MFRSGRLIAVASLVFVVSVLAGAVPLPFLAALPVAFVAVGLTERVGTSFLLAPLAAIGLAMSARVFGGGASFWGLAGVLVLSIMVGDTVARADLRRRRAEHRVERLLHSVRVLARVDDERRGAQLLASLAAELLGAQAVSVLLSDRPDSGRYLNRAYFGHPALADAAPLLVDSYGSDATRFVVMKRAQRAMRAAAIVPMPNGAGATVGLIIAMWGSPRTRFDAATRQAAELLSDEAGRMFGRLRESAALVHDAHTDPLTNLSNRRTFARALQTLQAGDALVIVDLDHFKSVNDRYGHQAGDETLRALAHSLRDTARQVDCVARYGGEEFALVLPIAGDDGARAFLHRVRASWDALDPATTFSAGIAIHEAGQSPRATLQRADRALYEAKDAGRNRDVFAAASDEVVLP